MTIRSRVRIAVKIVLLLVLLLALLVLVITDFWSTTSRSDGTFLYKPSTYLEQGADPTSNLFPVLYKVANNAGRYFLVKVFFKRIVDVRLCYRIDDRGVGERTRCY